jgi:hypothetical protein
MLKSKGQRLGLMAQAEQIAGEFSLSSEHVRRVTKHLVRQLSKETLAGLCYEKSMLTILSSRGRPCT